MAKATAAKLDPETPATADFPSQPRYVSVVKWIIGTAVFAYVLIRAFVLDPTADEVVGRLSYVDLLAVCDRPVEQAQLPSHLLGTVGADLLPFETYVSSRILNALFIILFLYSANRVTRFIASAPLQVLGFVTLICNVYVLDWFSLNRGYGQASAFAMTAFCFMAELMIRYRGKTMPGSAMFLATWSAAAAAMCNLAFLHFYVSFSAIVFLWVVNPPRLVASWKPDSSLLAEIKRIVIDCQYLFAAAAVLGAYVVPKFFILRTRNLLYSGGTVGFVHDSVGTVLSNSLYRIRLTEVTVDLLAWTIVAMTVFMGAYNLLRRDANDSRRISLLFFAGQIVHFAVVYSLHLTVDLNFIWHRGAIALILLFAGQLCFFTASLGEKVMKSVFVVLSAIYAAIALYSANLDYVLEQRMLSKQRKMLRDLEAIHEKTKQPILLGCSDTLKLKLNYFQEKWGLDWLQFYSIDMYVRFNRPYQIRPDTTHFYIWSRDGKFPEGLRSLPIEEVPDLDYPFTESDLYQVKPDVKLADYLRLTK
jgi:hypothetical protein